MTAKSEAVSQARQLIKGLLTVSLSFSAGGFTGNFCTKYHYETTYEQKIAALEAENDRRFVEDPERPGVFMPTNTARLDSIGATNKEDGSNIDRKRGGRR